MNPGMIPPNLFYSWLILGVQKIPQHLLIEVQTIFPRRSEVLVQMITGQPPLRQKTALKNETKQGKNTKSSFDTNSVLERTEDGQAGQRCWCNPTPRPCPP